MISFILNKKIVETNLREGSTLLDYIRYERQLTGTKIGCREGDCGACTVLIGDIRNNKMRYQSMTSCLTPLGNIHGKHVLTVEGINQQQLSPVQDLMISNNGTQCGFCTIGFVMSLTGFVLSEESPTYENAIKAIDGNICRCTGYKSIERAAKSLSDLLKKRPTKNTLIWLAENGVVPDYLKEIPTKLQTLKNKTDLNHSNYGVVNNYLIGGGTDLMVQKPEIIRKSKTKNILDDTRLKGIRIENKVCHIGASTTVTEFGESSIIKKIFPKIDTYLKLVSSTPIRNMATLGGNIVNASPIGDMTIFFLGLNSSVVLYNGVRRRTLLLSELFLDYKKLDKTPNEFIESIQFPVPTKSSHFNFEKVSKRTHLDIASVNSACQLKLKKNGTIASAHISAGGVAAIPKYLHQSADFLKNKKIDNTTLPTFLEILDSEISPISDARGTAAYKRLLLRQLVLAHFIQIFGPIEVIRKVLQGD